VPTAPQLHQVLPVANDYFPDHVQNMLLYDPAFAFLGETEDERYQSVYYGGLNVYTTFDPTAQAQAIAARDANLPLENGVFAQPGVVPPDVPAAAGQPNTGSAAIVSIEPATGAVRTMVAGPGFQNLEYNLVTQNQRQVGSSFKTYVLATLMDQGRSPDDMINGLAPCEFTNPNGTPNPYPVGNYADGGGSVGTVTDATTASSNCAFVRLGLIAGIPSVIDMAHRLGITSDLSAVPSLPLGVADITPLEMASAYATLAADGVYNPPYFIDRITDPNGNVLYSHTPTPEQRVSPQTARLVTSILVQNVIGGTGTRARISGQQAAGKTGTTQDSTDAWFVGYTPSLATAVWLGGLYHKFTINLGGQITGGRYPAQIWGAFMNAWQAGRPAVGFTPPTPVPSSGMLEVPGGQDLTPLPPPALPPPPEEPQPAPVPQGPPGQGGPPGQEAQFSLPTIPGFPG
jgi:penicillin-binding protein 1A